jgi:hypothetical protein
VLFRAAILLYVRFEGTIGAEGLRFKLLERRLNDIFAKLSHTSKKTAKFSRGDIHA